MSRQKGSKRRGGARSLRPGRRGFAIALFALVALAVVAIAGGTGAQTSETGGRAATVDRQELDRLTHALMPLLQYVREGQPRDALRQLSDPSAPTVAPAAMSAIRNDALSAVANIEALDATAPSTPTRHVVRIATVLYAETAGLAEDAARQGDAARQRDAAVLGGRLVRFADALFDQARRLGGQGRDAASTIRLDPPDPVPDIGPEAAGPALVRQSRRSVVAHARACLRRNGSERGADRCPDGPGLAMSAASVLHQNGTRSEQTISEELAFRVWAEAEQLRTLLAPSDAASTDHDRPRRLRDLARLILETNGGR